LKEELDVSTTSIDLPKLQVRDSDKQLPNVDVNWRRTMVMQLLSQGKYQRTIARELGVDKTTVSRDIKYIKSKVTEEYKNWIQNLSDYDRLKSLDLTEILNGLWGIANNEKLDISERIQAYLLISQSYDKRRGAITTNRQFIKALKLKYSEWLKKRKGESV